jgi:hypothetical protein
VERHASNIQGYLQLRNVNEKLHQQSNGLHTVLPKITNVSVKYDSKPNVNANSLGDVQLDVPLFITQWMGFRLRRNLLSTKKESLAPGYILKSLYVLTLLLSPGIELFPVLSSFPLLDLHLGTFLLC